VDVFSLSIFPTTKFQFITKNWHTYHLYLSWICFFASVGRDFSDSVFSAC